MNPSDQPRVAITGASGYLGGQLAAQLVQDGWQVRGLSRRPPGIAGVEHVRFGLGEELPPAALDGVDTLVHCAWDFDRRTWSEIEAVNVRGSERLFEAAAAVRVSRLVHVSTVSASGEPRSMYGRAKLETERTAALHGGVVVRPGLLYGPRPGGMVGMLRQLVRLLPVVPVLVGDRPQLYLAHEDDVCALLSRVSEGGEGGDRPLVGAARDPHTLADVLRAIAAVDRRRRLFVRVPWQLVYAALRTLEVARVPVPMRADSALSIGTLDPDPFASGDAPLTVHFRPFDPSVLTGGSQPTG